MATAQIDLPVPAGADRWLWVRDEMVTEVNRARHLLAAGHKQRAPIVWILHDLVGAARLYSLTEYADLRTKFHNAPNLDDAGLWGLLTEFVDRFDHLEPGPAPAPNEYDLVAAEQAAGLHQVQHPDMPHAWNV